LLMMAVVVAPAVQGRALDFIPHTLPSTGGLILEVAGLTLALWARVIMGRSFTIRARPADGGRLITSGPFLYVRNPVYLGALMMSFGWALVFASWWSAGFALAQLAVLLVKIRIEEAQLERRFGLEFVRYRARTRRFLPRLGRRSDGAS
jgi:protein-S-isoprenylcysteine O-methyltransferase Ste14